MTQAIDHDSAHELHTAHITRVFDLPLDQQPEMPDLHDGREPVNTETRIDRNESCWLCKGVYKQSTMKPMVGGVYYLCPGCHERKHGATEATQDSADLPWHFNSERGHIYDSEGRFVIQCKDVRRFDFYRRICRDHNVALYAGALVAEIDHSNTYAALEPRQYQLFRDALAAME